MTAGQMGTQKYEHWEPYDANAALRNQITRTRADLGETLSELAARADVKARARQAVSHARDRTRDALRQGARSVVAQTSRVARTGASSARSMLDRMGRTRAGVVVAGAAGALVGLGVYALARRRLPFSGALHTARARLGRVRMERARRERINMAAARLARSRRAHGRRR
jgi:hypothetical protein